MIDRTLYPALKHRLFGKKALIITGPRQVGKTTVIKKLIADHSEKYLFLDGDDPTSRRLLTEPNTEQLRQILGNDDIIFVDEAQRIPHIGITSKLITDQFSEKQLILSGSSAFELSGNMQEPLTGRKWTFELFPISWEEWQNHIGYLKAEQDLENRLISGFYPDVLNNPTDQHQLLDELVESYLYKDILTFANIRKPEVIEKLVQALAYQIGQEVVYKEIGDAIGLDPKTVSSYIDILEKAYVVFRLPSFSRNLRNEIKSSRKIYFYDNGVRNAIIKSYDALPLRQDVGALWENFLISERLKQLRYSKSHAKMYFWRTKQQQEIDYVEVEKNRISAFEFKWNPNRKIKFPNTFREQYNAETIGITRDNFREFVLPPKNEI